MTSAAERRDVPTFSECVVGYREWKADAHEQLWPLRSARRPWQPGINVARCNCRTLNSLRFEWSWFEGRRVLEPAPSHAAPDPTCRCGLYSWRRPRKAWYDAPVWGTSRLVVGAVASWGHLQVHAAGIRAECACIVALGYHCDTPPDVIPELERIAVRYRVELVPLAELEQAASCHGTPLPINLHPSSHGLPKAHLPAGGNAEADIDATARDTRGASQEPSTQPHRATGATEHTPAHAPERKIGSYALTALLGVAALAVGLLSLRHPVARWAFGEAHRSEDPPVWGVSLLVLPVVLLGFAIWRAWWTLELDIEAWRERRRRRQHQKTTLAAHENSD